MERLRFEREVEHLGLASARLESGPAAAAATLGFEFDLNVGVDEHVFRARAAAMPAGAVLPLEHQPLTTHAERDGAGRIVDGFSTKRDGPRMEISTTPFAIDDDAVFDAIAANVVAFGRELQAARKTRDAGISVPGVRGHPTRFEHPKTVIDRFPLVFHAIGPQRALAYPTGTAVWAAPQATLTLPLSSVGRLVWAVHRSGGKPPGFAFTGRPTQRLGLRSDLAMSARLAMLADRRRRIGTLLSDGTPVTEKDYSPALAGLVTLLTMYLLTGEKTDPRDAVESFAKGSLPLNVKTPLREVFAKALGGRERQVFRELYGEPAARVNLYRLAKPNATAADGANRLFPARTHADLDRFHASPPRWRTLVEHVVSDRPLKVTRANTVRKKGHALGDEILFAPLSSKIDFAKTDPRIAIEMRRLGFDPVPLGAWKDLMTKVRDLARQLNA